MKSVHSKILLVLAITTFGLWGCSQSGNDARSAAAKIRHLEYRNAKLEEDYRASIAEVTTLRKNLATQVKQVEDVTRQNQELQVVLKERDDLQQKLTTTEGDRDSLRVQMTTFGKELQALAGKVNQIAGVSPGGPALVTPVSLHK
jgi:predicted RNase H-like nuclease (RuvC/YqgF family)